MMRDRTPLDLDAARWAIRNGRSVVIPDLDVAVCDIDGHRFCFASDRVKDPIQRANRKGRFYEEEELALIRTHLKEGAVFVDVGANVGNHSLFVAAFLNPVRIIPFEPNPPAYKLLLANVVMNGFQHLFDLTHIGLGLADEKAEGLSMSVPERNLGAARMLPDTGNVATITGDEALTGTTPDFIKIDVEGMEMMVLHGLAETIARCAPMILIEVDRENDDAFQDWINTKDYEVLETFQRYQVNRNYLLKKRVPA